MESRVCGCSTMRGVSVMRAGFSGRALRSETPCLPRAFVPARRRADFGVSAPPGRLVAKRLRLPPLAPCPAASAASIPPAPPPSDREPLLTSLQRQITKFSQLWRSFLPMCSLFFFMSFINTIVNSLSLTLVITSGGGGAQVIPFLTVYAAFPTSLLFMVAYAWASHHLDRKQLFTLIVTAFGAFNLAFALFLYPNSGALHLNGVGEALAQVLPAGLGGAVGMVQNWTFTLFYCMSELWGDVGLSLLFWGFANEITSLEDAPVLYPLFGIGANIAQMLGGIALRVLSSSQLAFTDSLQKMILLVVACKVVVLILHHHIQSKSGGGQVKKAEAVVAEGNALGGVANRQFTEFDRERLEWMLEDDHRHYGGKLNRATWRWKHHHGMAHASHSNGVVHPPTHSSYDFHQWRTAETVRRRSGKSEVEASVAENDSVGKEGEKKKKSPTFMEALKTLSKSPAIRALGMMTIAQSLAVNLMEFVWKSHLRLAYPTPAAFTGFMGDVSTATGLITAMLMFVSPILFDRMGWRDVASVTPKLLSSGGYIFFGACLAYHVLAKMGMGVASQALLPWTVIGGAVLYVVARGAKFSLFKPAEEMVYIKLDKESQTKGKAAIDVVGAQMGKSGGSLLQQALLVASGGTLLGITPVIFGVYVAMLVGWQKAVDDLASQQEASSTSVASPSVAGQVPASLKIPDAGSHDNDANGGSSLVRVSAVAG
ncbi:hypothetical protein BSKO_04111 [Bryopsis sp. KO-2023]|nr:hypothetical protein BSKO_04111 [Bryopsis sp. KO-2023]